MNEKTKKKESEQGTLEFLMSNAEECQFSETIILQNLKTKRLISFFVNEKPLFEINFNVRRNMFLV